MNIEKIKEKYDLLKKESDNILPFDKVLLLEKAKEEFEVKYLSKIVKVDGNFIYFENGASFLVENFIKKAEISFGELSFLERKDTFDRLIIEMAFSFALMSISYFFDSKSVKYKVNVYWDM